MQFTNLLLHAISILQELNIVYQILQIRSMLIIQMSGFMGKTKDRKKNRQLRPSASKCEICFDLFDRYAKEPLIICDNNHSACRSCLYHIRDKRTCPFCRSNIKPGSVTRNEAIYSQLPIDPDQEIIMTQKRQQGVPHLNRSIADDLSQENVRLAQVPLVGRRQPSRMQHIRHELGLDEGDTKTRYSLYSVIFVVQVPFMLCNLVLSLASEKSECMDEPHGEDIYVLRPWLLGVGISEAIFLAILSLLVALRLKHIISLGALKKFEVLVGFLYLVKLVGWCVVELCLFFYDIESNCGGGIYVYGIIVTVAHGLMIVILLGLRLCNR